MSRGKGASKKGKNATAVKRRGLSIPENSIHLPLAQQIASNVVSSAAIKFSSSCTINCKQRATKASATMANLINAQRISFSLMSKHQQQQYLSLTKSSGAHYQLIHNNDTFLQQCKGYALYQFPLSSSPTTSTILCTKCFRGNLKLARQPKWRSILEPNKRITDIQLSAVVQSVADVHNFIQSRQHGSNVALVVQPKMIEKFQTRIILQSPKWKPVKHCRDGIMEYSECAMINEEMKQLNGTFTLDMSTSGSYVIAVKKCDLMNCINTAEKCFTVEFVYPEQDCKQWANDNLVLLSVGIGMQGPHSFCPEPSDFALFKKHKPNIIQNNKHFSSEGFYFGEGQHASYSKDNHGNAKGIEEYTTTNIDAPTFPLFQAKIADAKRFIREANKALYEVSGVDIVGHCSKSTTESMIHSSILKDLMDVGLDRDSIELSPLMVDGKSAIFPSVNINVNAGTNSFHTENDQGYTLIAVPKQDSTRRAGFLFSLKGNTRIEVRLIDGISVLFNARLLTHRQQIDAENGTVGNFWNIGCYSNRKYNNYSFSRLGRDLNSLLINLNSII
jgi:hypothetical protein